MADIDTYLHSIDHLFRQLNPVEVKLDFSIYLLEKVGVDRKLSFVSSVNKQELRWNTHFVNYLLDELLFVREVKEHKYHHSIILHRVFNGLDVTFTFLVILNDGLDRVFNLTT
jgi:hypothetical protein